MIRRKMILNDTISVVKKSSKIWFEDIEAAYTQWWKFEFANISEIEVFLQGVIKKTVQLSEFLFSVISLNPRKKIPDSN